jgi:hypothetical protein
LNAISSVNCNAVLVVWMLKARYLLADSALASVVAAEFEPVAQPENAPKTPAVPVPVPVNPLPIVNPVVVSVEAEDFTGAVPLKSQAAAA